MKASEFDQAFDSGGDISQALDWSKAERPALKPRRINVDIPAWMAEGTDREAARLGVPRQSVIKFWLAERLKTLG